MACTVLSPYDPQFTSHPTWPTSNGELYDALGGGSYEESPSFLSAICFPDGILNPSYFPQEDFSGGFQSECWRHGDFYEGDELPYYEYRDWPRDHESCLSSCWDHYFFARRDDSDDGEQWNGLRKENLNQNEEQSHDFYQFGEMQSSYEHDHTTGYGYWPEDIWAETTPEISQHEPTSSFIEPTFYENIFGYWPCLFQEEPITLW